MGEVRKRRVSHVVQQVTFDDGGTQTQRLSARAATMAHLLGVHAQEVNRHAMGEVQFPFDFGVVRLTVAPRLAKELVGEADV